MSPEVLSKASIFLTEFSLFFLDIHTRLLTKFHFPAMKFSLYFLGFEDANSIPSDADERTKWLCAQKATLELTQ